MSHISPQTIWKLIIFICVFSCSFRMKQAAFEIAVNKNSSLNEIRESLLDNEFMSDVTFVLENGNALLKAHRIFLMTASPIIQKLLTENNKQQLNIKVDQITKSIMMEVCRYAYTDEVKFTGENMFDILFAATKFEMKNLVEKTIEFICKQLSENTVFKTLELNNKFHNLKINMKCFEYIQKNPQKCLEHPEFLKISEDLLSILIETCKISEELVKNAIEMWTKANNSSSLEELLSLMKLKESSGDSDVESVASSKVSNSSKNVRHRGQRRHEKHTKKTAQGSSYSVSKFHGPGTNASMQQAGLKCFKLIGNIMRKNYKFANLDFSAKANNVYLHSLEFVYDLRTTDKEFAITVTQVDFNQRKTLYNDKVNMSSQNIPYFAYIFNREVEIAAFQKIWIKIEFSKTEYRLTFDKFGELQSNPMLSDITLRRDSECNSYSQIICAIYYNTR